MKKLLAAAVIAAAFMGAPAAAQMRALSDPVVPHPNPESLFTSPDAKLHRNKQAALHIQRDLLKCNKWSEAGKWLTDAYIQHNPLAASGLPGVIRYFVEVAKRKPLDPCPALSANDPNGVVMVSAEGDYVTILTRRIVPYGSDPKDTYTTTWFDTWRFVDGKADEHWDPATLPPAPPQAMANPAMTPPEAAARLADREAIEKLMWTYDRSLDMYDADRYAAHFTDDGAFGQTKGQVALKKMITDLDASHKKQKADGTGMGTMRHFTMNQFIEFTGPTSAKYHYYHQTVFGNFGRPGEKDAPKVIASGNGVDDLVKVDGKWLIKMRNVAAATDI
ncbi:nuclear transport factor 2 family protein [Tsuneonella sp. HG222]